MAPLQNPGPATNPPAKQPSNPPKPESTNPPTRRPRYMNMKNVHEHAKHNVRARYRAGAFAGGAFAGSVFTGGAFAGSAFTGTGKNKILPKQCLHRRRLRRQCLHRHWQNSFSPKAKLPVLLHACPPPGGHTISAQLALPLQAVPLQALNAELSLCPGAQQNFLLLSRLIIRKSA